MTSGTPVSVVQSEPGQKSPANSSTDILGADGVFQGDWEYNEAAQVAWNVKTDQAGTLTVEFSPDRGTTVVLTLNYSVAAAPGASDNGFFRSLVKGSRWHRVTYTNGSTPQTAFSLSTMYGPHGLFPPSASIEGTIDGTANAQNVRAVLTGLGVDGTYRNVAVSEQGSLLVVQQGGDVPVEQAIYQFLDTDGDGGGTTNANGNYSGAAEEFKITVPADTIYVINRMLVSIRDGGTFTVNEYGNLAELSNGVTIEVEDTDTTQLVDLTGGVPITTNAHWGRHCYDVRFDESGSGDNYIAVRWTFGNAGSPLVLSAGQSLVVNLNDDLSGLVEHYFMAQGYSRAA